VRGRVELEVREERVMRSQMVGFKQMEITNFFNVNRWVCSISTIARLRWVLLRRGLRLFLILAVIIFGYRLVIALIARILFVSSI
jgi:hypothetical protein